MKVIYANSFDFIMDLPIAIEKGYFKELGLDFEGVALEDNATRNSLLPKEDVHGAFLSSSLALFLIDKGLDLVLVCGIGNRTFDFAVLKDCPIKSIQDFNGKTIANVGKPQNPWLALDLDLAEFGVKPGKVVFTMDYNERISMLLAGHVDVILTSPAVAAKLGDDVRVVHSCTTSKYLWNSCGWFFKRDYLRKHPEAVKKFVDALAKARSIITDNQDEAIKTYSKYNKIDQSSFKTPFKLAQFDNPPVVYAYGLDRTYEAFRKYNLLKNEIDNKKIVDDRFAKTIWTSY